MEDRQGRLPGEPVEAAFEGRGSWREPRRVGLEPEGDKKLQALQLPCGLLGAAAVNAKPGQEVVEAPGARCVALARREAVQTQALAVHI